MKKLAALLALLAAASAHAEDTRQLVQFPPMLLEHEMANMRDHLQTLEKIQTALGAGQLDEAGRLAERRLGLSSFDLHGAKHVAPYMPEGMQAIGTEMHKAASRFALEVNKAAATGDLHPAIAALGEITAQCVACHAAYRLH